MTCRDIEDVQLRPESSVIGVNLNAQNAEQQDRDETSDFYGPKGLVQ